jgi:polyhydroxyalkanoate synthase subunit PhaC
MTLHDANVVVPRRAPARRAGTRERGDSPWLGQNPSVSPLFRQYEDVDRLVHPLLGPFAHGQSPATVGAAFMDWWVHLLASPAKRLELLHLGLENLAELARPAADPLDAGAPADALPQDKRFADPHWERPPFNAMANAFLLGQRWWQCATTGVPGVSRHHEEMVSFGARQVLDALAPSNCVATNPVVLERTVQEAGRNLLRGAQYAAEDLVRDAFDLPPLDGEAFGVGQGVACTPGEVIYRNRLIELIQYRATTRTTYPEPLLLVPAWIMKYYILDLSPHNSLVKALVEQGFTVFAISWKNPDAGDRDLGLADYVQLGVRAALEQIDAVMPGARTHALGYCLGGTLLAMCAAALGREGSKALQSLTLLAAQTDFAEPGELSLFIDESQVAFLEHQMWRKGFLDDHQMTRSFQMLRSKDLIWSYRVVNYLLGARQPVTDLMAWNADGTRLPYRMHSEYLRSLYLQNALAHGEFVLDERPVNLVDIRVPIFNLGAVQDHVAPWRSVFKLHRLTHADQTFVLTAGGHNVGIVNPPGDPRASYRIAEWKAGQRLLTPQEWLEQTSSVKGSWWTAWFDWLKRHSSRRAAPPRLGVPGLDTLGPAPGSYVLQR